MTDDATLLQRYARDRSESDFAELVRRHLDFVYSAALRQVNGDTHLAKDVAQLVFTDLARKASAVAGHRVLAGWLFTSTRYAAAKLVRANQRRQRREQEALLMQAIEGSDGGAQPDWERIRPVLDEALASLNERDREAILLRYFEGRDFAAVGAQLSLSDNAARMRVERAVKKLRSQLARRGATSTVSALTLALTGQAVAAAPAGLAVTVTGTAVAGSATVATFTFMSLTKLQFGFAGAVLATGAGIYAVQENNNAGLRAELATLVVRDAEIARLQQENRELADLSRQFATAQVSDADLARLRGALAAQTDSTARTAPGAATSSASGSASVRYDAADLIMIGELDERPKPKTQVAPKYPGAMATAGIEGSVVVSFVIDKAGEVQAARAVSSTRVEFEAAAVAAVEQWKFEPGRKNGRDVNTQVSQRIDFNLPRGKGAGTARATEDWF
jgi:RNA polymerase sigma factor (sigma-70 family)